MAAGLDAPQANLALPIQFAAAGARRERVGLTVCRAPVEY
jgi:hypothetical protein